MASGRPKMCLVFPKGTHQLQTVLMAASLVVHMSKTMDILVTVPSAVFLVAKSLFSDSEVRFWIAEAVNAGKAESLGFTVLDIPDNPLPLYERFGLSKSDVKTYFQGGQRDAAETQTLNTIECIFGPLYIVTHGPVNILLTPMELPSVAVELVSLDNPLDIALVLRNAAEVHAVDGWILTLADILGGPSKRVCHVYASDTSLEECTGKYRRRVVWVV